MEKLAQVIANETGRTLQYCATGEYINPQSIREGNGPDPKEDDPLWQEDDKKIRSLLRYYRREFGKEKSNEQFLLWIEGHVMGG